MSAVSLILLAGVVLGMSAGQILFKLCGRAYAAEGVAGLIVNPLFYFALLLYGGVTILWILVLSREPLSRVYPATALVYVIVTSAGLVFFGEKASTQLFIGVALVLSGIALITFQGTSR